VQIQNLVLLHRLAAVLEVAVVKHLSMVHLAALAVVALALRGLEALEALQHQVKAMLEELHLLVLQLQIMKAGVVAVVREQ
jgi:hypothetical protein